MSLNILPNGNIGLQSDQVTFIHLAAFAGGGQMVPLPAGDIDTVSTTGPFAASLGAAVGVMPSDAPHPGEPAVVLTPMVMESDAGNSGGNIGLTITDSAGLVQTMTKSFDIVPDLAAVSVGLDTTDSATQSQPTPTAPGPFPGP